MVDIDEIMRRIKDPQNDLEEVIQKARPSQSKPRTAPSRGKGLPSYFIVPPTAQDEAQEEGQGSYAQKQQELRKREERLARRERDIARRERQVRDREYNCGRNTSSSSKDDESYHN